VWLEHGKEVEGTSPDNWIDAENKIIRWPKKVNLKICFNCIHTQCG